MDAPAARLLPHPFSNKNQVVMDGWLPSASTVHDPAASSPDAFKRPRMPPSPHSFLSFSPVGNTVGGLCVPEIGGQRQTGSGCRVCLKQGRFQIYVIGQCTLLFPRTHMCVCVTLHDVQSNVGLLLVRDFRGTCQGHVHSEKGFEVETRGFKVGARGVKVRTRGLQSPWIVVLTYIGTGRARP